MDINPYEPSSVNGTLLTKVRRARGFYCVVIACVPIVVRALIDVIPTRFVTGVPEQLMMPLLYTFGSLVCGCWFIAGYLAIKHLGSNRVTSCFALVAIVVGFLWCL